MNFKNIYKNNPDKTLPAPDPLADIIIQGLMLQGTLFFREQFFRNFCVYQKKSRR